LVDTLEKTNEDFKRSQKELMTWATAAITQLNAKNELLVDSLLDARSKIKNFTFNIQVLSPPSLLRLVTATNRASKIRMKLMTSRRR
jgi:hypothetical protein